MDKLATTARDCTHLVGLAAGVAGVAGRAVVSAALESWFCSSLVTPSSSSLGAAGAASVVVCPGSEPRAPGLLLLKRSAMLAGRAAAWSPDDGADVVVLGRRGPARKRVRAPALGTPGPGCKKVQLF